MTITWVSLGNILALPRIDLVGELSGTVEEVNELTGTIVAVTELTGVIACAN